jgi:nitrite reductase/ring-hydroxylating ferredoxin subunit
MTETRPVVCRLDDIASPGSIAATVTIGEEDVDVLVVRKGAGIRAYRNRCPHTGAPLDWTPGQFLSADGKHIQCAMHAALFEIEDGSCIEGPCAGDRLEPVPLVIEGDTVLLGAG